MWQKLQAAFGAPWPMYNQCILARSYSSGVSAGLCTGLPLQLGNTVLGVTSVLCWSTCFEAWIDEWGVACTCNLGQQFAEAWQAFGTGVRAGWPLSLSVAVLLDNQQVPCHSRVCWPYNSYSCMHACGMSCISNWLCSRSQLEAAHDEWSCTFTTASTVLPEPPALWPAG